MRYAMGAALVVSLAVNGWLVLRSRAAADAIAMRREDAGAEARAAGEARSADKRVEATGVADRDSAADGERRLARELARCREEGWRLAGRAVGEVGECRRQVEAAVAVARAELIPADEQRELDAIAREHLLRHWRDKQAEIIAGLQRDAARPEWIDEDVAKKVSSQRERFGLGEGEARAVERGYRDVWGRHGAAVRELIAGGRWAELVDEAKDFWRDEDAMVARVLGGERGERYRRDDLRSRTAILAIFATFAERPWDEALAP